MNGGKVLNYLVSYRIYDRMEQCFTEVKDCFVSTSKGFYYASAIARHKITGMIKSEKLSKSGMRRYYAQILNIGLMDWQNELSDNVLLCDKE